MVRWFIVIFIAIYKGLKREHSGSSLNQDLKKKKEVEKIFRIKKEDEKEEKKNVVKKDCKEDTVNVKLEPRKDEKESIVLIYNGGGGG